MKPAPSNSARWFSQDGSLIQTCARGQEAAQEIGADLERPGAAERLHGDRATLLKDGGCRRQIRVAAPPCRRRRMPSIGRYGMRRALGLDQRAAPRARTRAAAPCRPRRSTRPTPRLTLFGFGSALNASVTPRIGSRRRHFDGWRRQRSGEAWRSWRLGRVVRPSHFNMAASARRSAEARGRPRAARVRSARIVDCPESTRMIVNFPDSPYELHQPFRAGGRPARGDRQAGRGLERRPRLPDAARRDRLGQDLHDGQRHRAHRPSRAGARAQQDAGRAALLRVPRVLSEQRGRVLRLVLRLLPARGLRAVARPVHREGFVDQRAHRADAAVGDQVDPAAARLHHRRHRVGDLRHRRPVRIPQHDPAPAPGRLADRSATRSSA